MNSRKLTYTALEGKPSERIPVSPQISHDSAVRIFALEDGVDWLEGMQRCMEDPYLSYEYTLRLARAIGCDGLRLWPRPEPVRVKRVDNTLIALDKETGHRIGMIDVHGGGYLALDSPPPSVETLRDAKIWLDRMVEDLTDEKLEALQRARQQAPDLFVTSASSAGMDLYRELRGNAQALVDLIERPDFVRTVMDLQAEAVVSYAERLLEAGIDSFVLGDASSSSSLISPKHFETICLPGYQQICHSLRQKTLVHLHICGNAVPILELMVETGAHIIEPLDPLGGVSVADAKRRVGNKVTLLGGVNGLVLARGTPEEVRAEAIRICQEGGPHGFVLAAGDMVPADTSLENLAAMVEVATKNLWKEQPTSRSTFSKPQS